MVGVRRIKGEPMNPSNEKSLATLKGGLLSLAVFAGGILLLLFILFFFGAFAA